VKSENLDFCKAPYGAVPMESTRGNRSNMSFLEECTVKRVLLEYLYLVLVLYIFIQENLQIQSVRMTTDVYCAARIRFHQKNLLSPFENIGSNRHGIY
jgi:hypothetical protein